MSRILPLLFGGAVVAFSSSAMAQQVDWHKVDDAFGRKGTVAGDVHRYGFPRTDLQVTLDGVTIKPGFALGSWVAFKQMEGGAMAMGDLVLLETEINPVMSKLIENGMEITAVHNHLLRANPATFYMHVGGHGDPVKIASALHEALTQSKTPLAPAVGSSQPQAAPAAQQRIDLDTAAIDQALGAKGKDNGGVYQFSIPRAEAVKEGAMAVPPSMGTGQAINFQPTGGGKAAITGDFVLTAKEVPAVLKALRENGIEVTAVHNHMLDEQPRLFFVHFWANDDARKLAQGLGAALAHVAIAKG